MKKWIALTTLAGTLALTVAVFAAPRGPQGEGPPDGRKGPGPMMRILEHPEAAEKLGLSEDQIAALQDLRYETQKAQIALQGEARLAQLEVERVLKSDRPDEAAAMAAVEQAGQARIKLQQSHISAMLQAREVIGEEKWNEMKEKVRERMNEQGRERMQERAGQMRERMERFREDGPGGDRPDRLRRLRRPGQGPQDGPPGV